jgi:alpha-amylase
MLYYGEEIGMAGRGGAIQPFGSEYCREPMDWYAAEEGAGTCTWFHPPDRVNRSGDGISVQEQNSDADSLLSLYRRLIRIRGAHSALRLGGCERIALTEDQPLVIAFLRQDAEDRVLVVFNLDRTPIETTLLLGSASMPSAVWNVVDLLGTRTWPAFSGGGYGLSLGAQEALVLELERP